MSNEIKETKCYNAIYCKPPRDLDFDLHLMKIVNIYEDGTEEKQIKLVKDFKKTFWVCNQKNRQHKQKKERFKIEDCETIKSTRMNLINAASQALGRKQFGRIDPQEVLRGPYTYGTDLSSSAELKYLYNQSDKAKDCKRFADVAVFDVETNIRDKNRWEFVEMATLSFKDRVFTIVDQYFFLEKYPNMTKEEMLEKLYQYDKTYLNEVNLERKINQEFCIADNEAEVLIKVFEKAHEWSPEFIIAWNMDYDITRSLKALKRAEIDPRDLFSDPRIPEPFRFFDYWPGKESSISKKGVWKNLASYEKWPEVKAPASFVFIDAMCFYYSNRKHKGKLPSYSLDYILSVEFPDNIEEDMSEKEILRRQKNSRIRKLKFEESKDLAGTVNWHIFMQSKYPFEYVIYNKFDCVSMEYMDEQTMDICSSLPGACEYSDYRDFESEPKRVANELHWFNLERGYAYGTGGKNNVLDFDEELIGRDDWIITLRADLFIAEGSSHFIDAEDITISVYRDNGDIDVTSSYPNGNSALNTSRETMTKELISIEGVDERERRECGINMSGGFVNSVEITQALFGAHSMIEMLTKYREQKNKV